MTYPNPRAAEFPNAVPRSHQAEGAALVCALLAYLPRGSLREHAALRERARRWMANAKQPDASMRLASGSIICPADPGAPA